ADATDPASVQQCVDKVYAQAGQIDVTFNGIGGRPSALGYPARSTETTLDDFLIPLHKIVGSQFLTAREVAKKMMVSKEGAIITLSATLSGGTFAYMAGITAACGAVESMTNALAGEFGPHGVRVNCVRGSAMPETRTIQETGMRQAELRAQEEMTFAVPPLGRPVSVADTANTAVFLASDLAAMLTAQMVTVCAGQFPTHI
ncbi:MAG: SDR family oxidoreductase, partial [Myxococcota bacterium]